MGFESEVVTELCVRCPHLQGSAEGPLPNVSQAGKPGIVMNVFPRAPSGAALERLAEDLSRRLKFGHHRLLRLGKTRIVTRYTLPASVTIDKDIRKPRLPRRPAILTVHTDTADIGYIAIHANMQIR